MNAMERGAKTRDELLPLVGVRLTSCDTRGLLGCPQELFEAGMLAQRGPIGIKSQQGDR